MCWIYNLPYVELTNMKKLKSPKKVKVVSIKGYPKINKLWKKLLKILPNPYRNLNLFIAPHNVSEYELQKGGWSGDGYLVIGQQLLALNDEHILIEFLCHELGHQVLGHSVRYDNKNSSDELCADQFGLFLAMKAGYDVNKLLDAQKRFERWRKKGIKKSHIKSHCTAKERYDYLVKQLKYLGYKEEK